MEAVKLSIENVAAVVIFVAPGYFATFAYDAVHTKSDKDFSKLLIECISFSLPIVGLYNAAFNRVVLSHFPKGGHVTSTQVIYFLPLLVVSLGIGYTWARLRGAKWILKITRWFKLPDPDEDYIKVQFKKLKPDELISVTLKNGSVFSGVRKSISAYKRGDVQRCYFNDIAWYDKSSGTWENKTGSLILAVDDIAYIETSNTIRED